MNLFLKRDLSVKYSTNGRREDEEEARIVDKQILTTLDIHNEAYSEVSNSKSELSRVTNAILAHLNSPI